MFREALQTNVESREILGGIIEALHELEAKTVIAITLNTWRGNTA